MYVSMGTRPDITFVTSTVAQFLDNPGWAHWEAVKHIFRYLKGTKNWELVYGGAPRDLAGFVDADGASQDHRRAISGYVFMVDGGAVSWCSKKQELVTLSTAEAEYVAATHAAKEAVWFWRLISDLSAAPTDPPRFSETINRPSLWPTAGSIMRGRSTLTFGIILFVTLSRLALFDLSMSLPTNKPPTLLPRPYRVLRRSTLQRRWGCVLFEGEYWSWQTVRGGLRRTGADRSGPMPSGAE